MSLTKTVAEQKKTIDAQQQTIEELTRKLESGPAVQALTEMRSSVDKNTSHTKSRIDKLEDSIKKVEYLGTIMGE